MYIDDSGKIIFDKKDEFDQLSSMVKGISRKYHGWSGLSAEDIENELWIKVLEVIKSTGTIEMDLLARCCFNKAIDLYRSAKRIKLQEFTIDPDVIHSVIDITNHSRYTTITDANYSASACDDYSSVYIDELINLFDEGTKERQYLVALSEYLGIEVSIKSAVSPEFGSSRLDNEIACILGYSNDTSQGYRKLKNRVRGFLCEYYRNSGSNNCGGKVT